MATTHSRASADPSQEARTPEQEAAVRAVGVWVHQFARTLKTCRLYDFENHRWLDFDGKPTTGVLVTEAERAAMIEHGPGVMYAGAKA